MREKRKKSSRPLWIGCLCLIYQTIASLKQVGKSDVFMPKIIFLVVQAVPLHRINKEDLNKGVTES